MCIRDRIGTALRAVPELQVFHFDRLPGFKGGFLFQADFHVTDCIGAFPFVCPHVFQFVRVPVPADEHGDLFAAFRVFDLCDAAQVASTLQVALFLLGEVVFMERALQQLFILLYAMQLGYYRTVPVSYTHLNKMKQIKAHIAVSLDGHTATLDQELDWLPDEVKTIIGKHYMVVDSLLMGANTYNYIFEHWGGWPHKSKRSFVVSHYDTNVTPDCGVEFLTEEPLQRIYELKQERCV